MTREQAAGGSPYAGKPWLKHYPPQVSGNLEYPYVPLTRLLEKSAREFPDSPATEFFGARLTYMELLIKARKFARALAGLGVEKGDRVALMLPNCPQAVIAFYGALLLGTVVVQVNPLYVERELEFQLKDSGARTLVVLDLLYPRVEGISGRTGLQDVIVTRLHDYMPLPLRLLFPLKQRWDKKTVEIGRKAGVYLFQALLREATPFPPPVEVKATDLALLQYTGGTTGVAKGAMLTHRNLVSNVYQIQAWMLDVRAGREKMFCALPFFHVYGMTVGMNLAVLIAAEMIILPKFELERVLKAINKHKPTFFPGAPTMYVALNTYPGIGKYDLSSIRSCISGSAPLPLEVQETFERISGGKLVEGYGLTEASPVTHCNPLSGLRKNGTIGVPLADTECKIIDPASGEESPVGEAGELLVKGPQVMLGYWGRPEESAACLRDGWLFTGDMARMDEDGFFQVVDRKKDIIIAGGFNIYPREIEEVLYQHPKIKEAAVIGVPDPYRGETVKAFVVLKANEQCSDEEIIQFCRTKLAAFKVPRILEFRQDLPKSIIGKVLKRLLLEQEQDSKK